MIMAAASGRLRGLRSVVAVAAAAAVCATAPYETVRTLDTSMDDVIPSGGGCKHYIMTLPSSTPFSVNVVTSSTSTNSLVVMLGAPFASCAAYNTVRASTSNGGKTVYVSGSDTFFTGTGQEYHMFVQAAVGMSFTFTITSLPNMPAVQFMALGTYIPGALLMHQCSMYAFVLPPSAGFQVSLMATSGDPDLVLGISPPSGPCDLWAEASASSSGSDYITATTSTSYFRGNGQTIFVRVRAFSDTTFTLSVNNLAPSPSPAPGSSSSSSSGTGAANLVARIGGIAGGAIMVAVAGVGFFILRRRRVARAHSAAAARTTVTVVQLSPMGAAGSGAAGGGTPGGGSSGAISCVNPMHPEPTAKPAPPATQVGGYMPTPAPPGGGYGYGYGYGGAPAPNPAAPAPYGTQPTPYPYGATAPTPTPNGPYPTMPGALPAPAAVGPGSYPTTYYPTMPSATDSYPPVPYSGRPAAAIL